MSLAAGASLKQALGRLPPMARQNVSWVARLPRWLEINKGDKEEDDDDDVLARALWTELERCGFELQPKDQQLRKQQHYLRIEVHPSHRTAEVCGRLERHVARFVLGLEQWRDIVEPFVDSRVPLQWTKSRAKCTHRLSVILLQEHREQRKGTDDGDVVLPGAKCNDDDAIATASRDCRRRHHHFTDTTSTVCYYGAEARDPTTCGGADGSSDEFLLDIPLNDRASGEIVIVPDDDSSGSGCEEDVDEEDENENEQVQSGYRDDGSETKVPSNALSKKRRRRRKRKNKPNRPGDDRTEAGAVSTFAVTNTTNTKSTVIPLSRAYYKLHQVWKDYLEPENFQSFDIKKTKAPPLLPRLVQDGGIALDGGRRRAGGLKCLSKWDSTSW
jgi:hypothetical protein